MNNTIASWGNYPKTNQEVVNLSWKPVELPAPTPGHSLLPYGCGRSYGDVALNDGNTVIVTRDMSRFVSFDRESGVLVCEAGVTLGEILELVTPHGWFLPVVPGTKFVTVGGAIANDVHGKNHHLTGTFGCHINQIELLRSEDGIVVCSQSANAELFAATIGGLGLTGLILTAEIQLQRVDSPSLDIEKIVFPNLEEGLALFAHHSATANYSVAWVDCLATGNHLGRGELTLANHSRHDHKKSPSKLKLGLPFFLPNGLLNNQTIKLFNQAFYRRAQLFQGTSAVHYDRFLFPLDSIANWNRMYGPRGFLQYQCVIPFGKQDEGIRATKELMSCVASSQGASFLAVLKTFGSIKSPGLLSFPMEGITLALDFPFKGPETLGLLEQMDNVVLGQGGRVYPAKDARLSHQNFNSYYPNWREFEAHIDNAFDSSFWRRVSKEVS